MFVAKLAACILMIPPPGLYFKFQKLRPFSRLWTVVFMTPVVFGKKEGSCGDNCIVFWGEVQDTLQIFGGTITIGGVLLYSCVEKRR